MCYRRLSFVFALFLSVIIANNVWATNAEDDCFFAWAEGSYPTFIAPSGSPSQSLPPYYYRYYSTTNSYLGINSSDQHLYYLSTAGEMLDLGPYAIWKNQSGCQASTENGAEDISRTLNQVFGLSKTVTDSGLTDQIEPLLFAFLGMPSTCPAVSTNLDLASLSGINISDPNSMNTLLTNFPDPMSAQVNYGSGCSTAPNGPLMSGSADIVVSNFSLNTVTGILNAQFTLAADNLKENRTLLADGTMNGSLNLNMNNMTGSATINLVNFQTATDGTANGTATLTISSATSYLLSINISNSVNLSANLDISVFMETDDRYIINTTNAGTINQYTVIFNDIVFDHAVCENYPVGGSAIFSGAGENWTATFDSSCNGRFILQ